MLLEQGLGMWRWQVLAKTPSENHLPEKKMLGGGGVMAGLLHERERCLFPQELASFGGCHTMQSAIFREWSMGSQPSHAAEQAGVRAAMTSTEDPDLEEGELEGAQGAGI